MATTTPAARTSTAPAPIKAVPIRHYGQWASAAVVLLLAGGLLYSVAANDNIQWSVVGDYMFRPEIFHGIGITLALTVLSMVLGVIGGVLLAVMRLSGNPVLRAVSGGYLWIFRGTPVLVQIVIWFNLALVFPRLGVGSFSVDTNHVISPFGAALLALALNEAAYMAEIVRGGILSVDQGQTEAAHALGYSGAKTMRLIVLPQAMRVIVPPTGNEVVTMLKTTALVYAIGAADLFTEAYNFGSKNFTLFEMYLVASFWYLVMTTVLSTLQSRLEKKYAKGSHAVTTRTGGITRLFFLRNAQGGVA
ncbi:polar amino acid ABC transporter permease [Nocardioides phosphati]|uniref:Polar amino acid ABC transporter permease n=1 Tax=Nocardioides phosphati TaxID=1867775 RepID=A0ABQ2N8L1_9ACTN|nr:amino acid ABC transporter permease [Nocardioides phosphati]GGO88544.1 polar amino acid ABC transporter permease [Nocardioides phosphati]